MAIAEGTPQVPDAMGSRNDLRKELRRLEKDNGVMARLSGYAAIVGQHAHSDRRSVLTLELKRQEQELRVVVHESLSQAETRLAALEALDDENLDAVLIGINRIGQLQSAYPNYYANTTMFTGFVGEQLA